jgi:hypothetical protein
MFFFEKKNQKTFVHLTSLYPETPKPAPNQLLPVDVRARGTIQISTTKTLRTRRYTKDFMSCGPTGAHRSRAGTFVRLRALGAFVVEISFLLSRATRPPYPPFLCSVTVIGNGW